MSEGGCNMAVGAWFKIKFKINVPWISSSRFSINSINLWLLFPFLHSVFVKKLRYPRSLKIKYKTKVKKKKIQYFHQSYDIFVFGSKIIKLSVSHIEKISLENFTLRARHLKNLKSVHWILTRLDDVNRTILIKVSPFRVLFIFPFHLAVKWSTNVHQFLTETSPSFPPKILTVSRYSIKNRPNLERALAKQLHRQQRFVYLLTGEISFTTLESRAGRKRYIYISP